MLIGILSIFIFSIISIFFYFTFKMYTNPFEKLLYDSLHFCSFTLSYSELILDPHIG